MHKPFLVVVVLALGLLLSQAAVVQACPFCSAVQVTFTEEIKQNEVAVIATLVSRPDDSEKAKKAANGDLSLPQATFEIVEVLKGDKHARPKTTVKTLYFGEAKVGTNFLIMGIVPPKIEWGTPIEVSERGRAYLKDVMKLPAKGVERLTFFQKYLQDPDVLIARDSYDEFATTSYADLKAAKDQIDHAMLVTRLKDIDIDASYRRLYFTLLGIRGSKADVPMLEKMLKSKDREQQVGLDALIACYLTLNGEAGLPLIGDRFIKDQSVEFSDQYQALMALRFVAEEGVISKEKVGEVLRLMLERPKYADQVIPDLARWKDWSVMEKVNDLFRTADDNSLWVREPAINYMRACPLPKAKEYIIDFEKIDPEAFERSKGFFPLKDPKTSPVGEEKNSAAQRPAADGASSSDANGSDAANAKAAMAAAIETLSKDKLANNPPRLAKGSAPPMPLSDDSSSPNTSAGGEVNGREMSDDSEPVSTDALSGTDDSAAAASLPVGSSIATAKPNADWLTMLVLPLAVGLVVTVLVLFLSRGSEKHTAR
ncbi:MAG: hypothetical protein SGJ20_15915 [Planctomycetota bacterium]|nr:hypothetical protein [Planctomycetota bacterium]